jgi:hypothetical protein
LYLHSNRESFTHGTKLFEPKSFMLCLFSFICDTFCDSFDYPKCWWNHHQRCPAIDLPTARWNRYAIFVYVSTKTLRCLQYVLVYLIHCFWFTINEVTACLEIGPSTYVYMHLVLSLKLGVIGDRGRAGHPLTSWRKRSIFPTPSGFGGLDLKTSSGRVVRFGLQNPNEDLWGGTWRHWRACVEEKWLHEGSVAIQCLETKLDNFTLSG